MSLRKLAVLTALIPTSIAMTACNDTSTTTTSTPLVATNDKPPCVGDVVTVNYGNETECDVSPPQQLDVVMSRFTPNPGAECDDMGGWLMPVTEGDPQTDWLCWDVDH